MPKDWDKIYDYFNRLESAQLDANTFAAGLVSVLLGPAHLGEHPIHECTHDALHVVRDWINQLPELIANDISDPLLRWEWARKLYWGKGSPTQTIARHLLNCPAERVHELIGPSPKSLICFKCRTEFFPVSTEDWRTEFVFGFELVYDGPVCDACRSKT